jgi:hypothetical protein
MFKLLKNNLLNILDETQSERSALRMHPLYHSIKTEKHLHLFMQNHVYAVWDFMSVLKSLQRDFTCVEVPWRPKNNGNLSRLLNEIVLAEESDIDRYGQHLSHFEIYYHAMKEAGANTASIENFLKELDTSDVSSSLMTCNVPKPAKDFVLDTFKYIELGLPHLTATIFTLGREEIIPDMFRELVHDLNNNSSGNLKSFIYYLDRHIGLDENEHTPLALKMIKEICGDDEIKWKECIECGKSVMKSRIKFWDEILSEIEKD